MKIYISGKVAGIETEAALLFEAVANKITALGHTPINPMQLDHSQHNKTWEAYMRVCITAMMQADAVLALHNAVDSKGAKVEIDLADKLKMPILQIDELLAQPPATAQGCDATLVPPEFPPLVTQKY